MKGLMTIALLMMSMISFSVFAKENSDHKERSARTFLGGVVSGAHMPSKNKSLIKDFSGVVKTSQGKKVLGSGSKGSALQLEKSLVVQKKRQELQTLLNKVIPLVQKTSYPVDQLLIYQQQVAGTGDLQSLAKNIKQEVVKVKAFLAKSKEKKLKTK